MKKKLNQKFDCPVSAFHSICYSYLLNDYAGFVMGSISFVSGLFVLLFSFLNRVHIAHFTQVSAEEPNGEVLQIVA